MGANDVEDVASYVWYSSFDPTRREVSVPPGGAAAVTITPPSRGPHVLYVQSLDAAGNRSDTRTYLFYAN